MSRPLKSTFAAIFLICVASFTAGSAMADTYTYSYTGSPFNQWANGAACPPVCNVVGSFTIGAQLGANFSGNVTPLFETMTSSGFTLTPDNINQTLGYLFVTTDALGNINSWIFSMYGDPGTARIYTTGDYINPVNSVDDARFVDATGNALPASGLVFSDPGTWTETTNVPEPSVLTLLGIGILGLVGLSLKRT